MREESDAALLRDYADSGNDAAFREIATRYTDLVYSAALRQTESSELSADIAQSVFIHLALKAKPVSDDLAAHASLVGWLHRSTRYAALNHLREERRRFKNERVAMEQLLTNSESSVDWEQMRVAIDEGLDTLADEDRQALLLRYFKNQDFRNVGLAMGISDDAAQKRVSRAIERLREFFAKRGITVGASGLAIAISTNAVQAAPIGLALTISTAATIGGTAFVAVSTTTATKAITMTALQKTLIAATLTACVVTPLAIQHQSQIKLREENASFRRQLKSVAEMTAENERPVKAVVDAKTTQPQQDVQFHELLRLRGQVGVLRNQTNEIRKLQDDNRRLRTALERKGVNFGTAGSEGGNAPVVEGEIEGDRNVVLNWNGVHVSQALETYAGLTMVEVDDLPEPVKKLKARIVIHSEPVTRHNASGLIEKALWDQGGVEITHPATNLVSLKLRRS